MIVNYQEVCDSGTQVDARLKNQKRRVNNPRVRENGAAQASQRSHGGDASRTGCTVVTEVAPRQMSEIDRA
jgi:hypothetical protein